MPIAFGRARQLMMISPTLVLRKARIDDHENAATLVEVTGRAAGIISWLLTLLKIEPETSLVINRSECSFTSASLMGVRHVFVPLYEVSSTACAYHRPLYYLFIAGVIAASSLWVADITSQRWLFWVTVLLALASFLAYFLRKQIRVSVETSGGAVFGLQFKPSVIESISIDLPQAIKLIGVVNNAVLRAKGLRASPDSAHPENAFAHSAAANRICPSCLSPAEAGSRFCDNCGSSLA